MTTSPSFPVDGAADVVLQELNRTVMNIQHEQLEILEEFTKRITSAQRVFFSGAGRSGLAIRMMAMRFMHLGIPTYVIGETTTPAVQSADLVVIASGSGSTSSMVSVARKAKEIGAQTMAITANPESPLSRIAEMHLTVNTANKNAGDAHSSAQFAGSLFEQALVVVGDSIFHAAWKRSAISREVMSSRHANME